MIDIKTYPRWCSLLYQIWRKLKYHTQKKNSRGLQYICIYQVQINHKLKGKMPILKYQELLARYTTILSKLTDYFIPIEIKLWVKYLLILNHFYSYFQQAKNNRTICKIHFQIGRVIQNESSFQNKSMLCLCVYF